MKASLVLSVLSLVLIFALGYLLAKQMGGDADLYVDVLIWQTLLCLIMLPIWAHALIG